MILETLNWLKEGTLKCLDQTRLPQVKEYRILKSREEVYDAIKKLIVRGAPAIGIAGAYGICVDLFQYDSPEIEGMKKRLGETASYLKSSRPTAVNLSWAVDRMLHVARSYKGSSVPDFRTLMIREAKQIHEEDRIMCEKIGKTGAEFIRDGMRILTHCNAGSLATGGIGTALAVLYEAKSSGKKFSVFADETRPLLQGARLTAFELMENGIDVTLICDSMAGYLMKQGKIDLIVTGADRIAANGDTANKIGTYTVAKMASQFNIPFYIAAPSSTFDLTAKSEKDIVIEERPDGEIKNFYGTQTAPENVKTYNPAFDVTDAALIHGFFTEKGLIPPPYEQNIPERLK